MLITGDTRFSPSSRKCEIRRHFGMSEAELLPARAELGIGFVPLRPLGTGFLTGKVDATTTFATNDFRGMSPRFAPEVRQANLTLVDMIRGFAKVKAPIKRLGLRLLQTCNGLGKDPYYLPYMASKAPLAAVYGLKDRLTTPNCAPFPDARRLAQAGQGHGLKSHDVA